MAPLAMSSCRDPVPLLILQSLGSKNKGSELLSFCFSSRGSDSVHSQFQRVLFQWRLNKCALVELGSVSGNKKSKAKKEEGREGKREGGEEGREREEGEGGFHMLRFSNLFERSLS